jgi:hypothetical protein
VHTAATVERSMIAFFGQALPPAARVDDTTLHALR